jgi:hypothetical protein
VEVQNESMRPVEFGEAVPTGTRLTLFSADKPDRLFTVITFWRDKVSGLALDLETGVPPIKSKTRKAEFIYCFTCQSRKRMKTAGAFGGRIRQDLTQGPFLMTRWSRSRKAGAMECWITVPERNSEVQFFPAHMASRC